MSDALIHTSSMMGTVVTIEVVGHGHSALERAERAAGVERAIAWFEHVTAACSRFEPTSEVARLSGRIGEAVPVSPLLFEAVQFACRVAEMTDGAFDPTVGHRMMARAFDTEFRSGRVLRTDTAADDSVSWRDVVLDEKARTITLRRALVLDLGAVAKGIAIDMAARELVPFRHFAIDAGGDLYVAGCAGDEKPWRIGIRHPRDANRLIETLRVSNAAVCTSGDYERRSPADNDVHHIRDPRADTSAAALASVTVIAPSAMVADALSTAAFVLGPKRGVAFLESHGVDGFMLSPSLERFDTAAMSTDQVFEQLLDTSDDER